MAATLDRRIRIVRQRISRTHGQAKRAEQYAILNNLLAQQALLLDAYLFGPTA
jgi:hypothetical protein